MGEKHQLTWEQNNQNYWTYTTERKETHKQTNRASGTYGTVTKDLIFLALECQKEKKKEWGWKVFREIMAKTFHIWQETQTYRYKKLGQLQTGETQRNPCKNT